MTALRSARRQRFLVNDVRIDGYRVDCVDATGAGDCFAGALLARMSAGEDFWRRLRYANAAARADNDRIRGRRTLAQARSSAGWLNRG